MEFKENLNRPVSAFILTDYARVSIEQSVADAAAAMRSAGTTEAVVADGGGLVGLVTERDILYKVVAEGLDPKTTRIGAVMSAPVETIEESAKVSEAIAKMSSLGVSRLGVTRGGKFVGLISQMSLVSGRIQRRVRLPELTEPGGLKCPYCGANEKDNKELSKHIDQDHLGLGLLEGNRSKW
ncbi:MAG TPA: CBS domain-containing protein [Nitrososphaerales archaeon]|nr:CBS domain-containing protein [Nitrososphaerales archaeon]